MGLIIPGFIPDTLGEIYEYTPTMQEILISIGIWATGALLYTFMLKLAIPVYTGKLRFFSKAQLVNAHDIMSHRMAVVEENTPFDDMAKLLLTKHLNDIAVVDKEGRLIGTLADTDLISLEAGETAGKTAADIMRTPSGAIQEDIRIQELGKELSSRQVNRLFVINKEGQPVGMVSGSDILKTLEHIRNE